MDPSPTVAAIGRASRRAVYHLLQAGIDGLKAGGAVIEEIGAIGDEDGHHDHDSSLQNIEIE